MTKKEFMQKLKDNLIGLNQNDKREVLLDYEEHFMDGKNQGRTEEEICEALGDPKEIAREIKAQSQQYVTNNNDGANLAGYIICIILLSLGCLALASLLVSVLATAVSGIFGAVAVAAVISEPMLRIAAISGIVLTIAICTLIALGIVKLIPLVVKWYKQLIFSLDGKTEEAKNVKHKNIKIHAVFWIILGVLCVASICGVIVGGVGFAKNIVEDFDSEDVHELTDIIRDLSKTHRGWVYYGTDEMEDFKSAMEDFADDMEEFAGDMEDTFDDHDNWYFGWHYVFGD